MARRVRLGVTCNSAKCCPHNKSRWIPTPALCSQSDCKRRPHRRCPRGSHEARRRSRPGRPGLLRIRASCYHQVQLQLQRNPGRAEQCWFGNARVYTSGCYYTLGPTGRSPDFVDGIPQLSTRTLPYDLERGVASVKEPKLTVSVIAMDPIEAVGPSLAGQMRYRCGGTRFPWGQPAPRWYEGSAISVPMNSAVVWLTG